MAAAEAEAAAAACIHALAQLLGSLHCGILLTMGMQASPDHHIECTLPAWQQASCHSLDSPKPAAPDFAPDSVPALSSGLEV